MYMDRFSWLTCSSLYCMCSIAYTAIFNQWYDTNRGANNDAAHDAIATVHKHHRSTQGQNGASFKEQRQPTWAPQQSRRPTLLCSGVVQHGPLRLGNPKVVQLLVRGVEARKQGRVRADDRLACRGRLRGGDDRAVQGP